LPPVAAASLAFFRVTQHFGELSRILAMSNSLAQAMHLLALSLHIIIIVIVMSMSSLSLLLLFCQQLCRRGSCFSASSLCVLLKQSIYFRFHF